MINPVIFIFAMIVISSVVFRTFKSSDSILCVALIIGIVSLTPISWYTLPSHPKNHGLLDEINQIKDSNPTLWEECIDLYHAIPSDSKTFTHNIPSNSRSPQLDYYHAQIRERLDNYYLVM